MHARPLHRIKHLDRALIVDSLGPLLPALAACAGREDDGGGAGVFEQGVEVFDGGVFEGEEVRRCAGGLDGVEAAVVRASCGGGGDEAGADTATGQQHVYPARRPRPPRLAPHDRRDLMPGLDRQPRELEGDLAASADDEELGHAVLVALMLVRVLPEMGLHSIEQGRCGGCNPARFNR